MGPPVALPPPWACHLKVSTLLQKKQPLVFSLIPSELFWERRRACGCVWARSKSGTPGVRNLQRPGVLNNRVRSALGETLQLEQGEMAQRCWALWAAVSQESRQLRLWMSRTSAVTAGARRALQNSVPHFASLVLWVPVGTGLAARALGSPGPVLDGLCFP